MAAALAAPGTGCGGRNKAPTQFQKVAVPASVFSGPESELTCNLSGSRKRTRDELQQPMPLPPSSSALFHQQKQMQQQLLLQKQQLLLLHQAAAAAADLPSDRSRLVQSTMTSTTGRPPLVEAAATASQLSPGYHYNSINNRVPSDVSSSSSLISMLHHHSLEVDALLRLHAEKLRSGLDEARKRQCRAFVAAIEQQAQRRIAEQQAELDAAAERRAELEERLRQAAAEGQAWFDVARNSEALVAELRAGLEQALQQKLTDGINHPDVDFAADAAHPCTAAEEEGYGDSQEEAAASYCPARYEEASTSSAVGAARKNPPAVPGLSFLCKSCGDRNASVLLLPCRHLCLCPSCEPSVGDCPICSGRKSATLQINLS